MCSSYYSTVHNGNEKYDFELGFVGLHSEHLRQVHCMEVVHFDDLPFFTVQRQQNCRWDKKNN